MESGQADRRAARKKKSTTPPAAAGDGDERCAPISCRRRACAPVKIRSHAHGATQNSTTPLAAAANGDETGMRDVRRAPAVGTPGPQLRHAARRTVRQKRARRHLLPPPTGTRDVRRLPAGGAPGPPVKIRSHTHGATQNSTTPLAAAANGDETGMRDVRRAPAVGTPGPQLRHAARRTVRQKRARRHLLPPPTGTRDVRRLPAGGAPGPPVRIRSQARRETKKSTAPLAAVCDGNERCAPITCRRCCRRAQCARTPTKWS